MTTAKKRLTPILATLLIGSTLASAQTQPTSTPTSPRPQQQRSDRPDRAAMTIKYYSGHPLKGGKLLLTTTLQPPTRADRDTPASPFANAPTNATYVAISTPFGTRITTLKAAQAAPFGDHPGQPGRDGDHRDGQRGAPGTPNGTPNGTPGRGDRPTPPNGQDRPGDRGAPNDRVDRGNRSADQSGAGLRLPGLRDASSVTFYATDPLTGGQAQHTINLSATPTAQQQQAITQASSKAKYAVIERNGETVIVNLTTQPGAPR
ncbi:hypothetical protein [Deinococcus maricopensis]|uniref:Uncharacterized protein n=1 Tax=Deinococcus maricopensis (strain DSM 21211 / LMG 22137 / NRRL B-23946 / LB-34) TaxID=709986 RepID=E8U4C5_DEIML|nr:hypothetical protein [Deinococcus maricopensis]ADV65962.1 hypothetical protein Deima_0301 [Deinococcus maricopensis DSM 21211]